MTTLASPAEFTIQRPSYQRSSAIRWIFSHAIRHNWIIIMIVLGAFGNAALAAVVPVLVGDAFNAMLQPAPDIRALIPLALLIGGTQVFRGALQLGRNFGAELLGQRLETEIRDELYISLLGKSMTFHSLQPVGDTMARATNDVREVNLMFSPGINLVIGSFFFLIMPILAAPRYHPSLLLTPVIFALFYFAALAHYLKTLHPISDEVRASFGDMNTHLSESLDGVETVKGSAQENSEVDRFVLNAKRVRDAFIKQGDTEARFIAFLLYGIAIAAGLTHALFLFREGLLNTGQVIAYFGLLRMLDFPTFTSTWAYTQVSMGLAGARRILELLNRETDLDQNTRGYSAEMKGEIEFKNVSFGYKNGKSPADYDKNGSGTGNSSGSHHAENVLENVSFKVRPGQTVAVVGQTGAGKTSLLKLINRTYDASAGQVLVDGVDVREWNMASLRSQISMIEQDIFLFSRSISDNIAFGRPGASQADVQAAARSAQAHDFIQTFDQGYQTVIGERGVTLSGGQRQRLALGRAFMTDPRILILDDSTSAIDSATEDLIQRAISAAARGRTTFIVTHRLSQIRWADLIIVLRKGRVVAMGSHEELMRTSEAYGRIFRE
ncbi:MAG: ABC transporter ATP-binding protein [Anaerolineales bacterium]|jgi:ATP-binding cassette subfamily B protein|nr:ABC transporter ATP-binding protein [Anaerolineales bacterium]